MADLDEQNNFALAVVGVAAAVAVAVALAVAIGSSHRHAAARSAAASGPDAKFAGAPVVKVYFEVGTAELPAGSSDTLLRVIEMAHAYAGSAMLISGFHDASGDPQHNAELARARAEAVQKALVDSGIPANRLQLAKPTQTAGGSAERDARRVEIRLQ